jgi:hypothetical protein
MCTGTDKSGQEQTVTTSVASQLSCGGRGSNHSETLGRITGDLLPIMTCLRIVGYFEERKASNESKQICDMHAGLYINPYPANVENMVSS